MESLDKLVRISIIAVIRDARSSPVKVADRTAADLTSIFSHRMPFGGSGGAGGAGTKRLSPRLIWMVSDGSRSAII
jgi:hypothetical protein